MWHVVKAGRAKSLGPTAPGSLPPDGPTPRVRQETLNSTRCVHATVRNGTSDKPGTRTNEFQISDRTDFSSNVLSYIPGLMVVVSRSGVPEGSGGTTSFTPDADLQPTTRMYWRARMGQGASTSDWSATAQFRTRVGGFNRAGELFDPLITGDTIGERRRHDVMGTHAWGDNASSCRYVLANTLTPA